MNAAPSRVIFSSEAKGLSVAIWDKELPDGNLTHLSTITAKFHGKNGKSGYKTKAFFDSELVAIIELIILALQAINPDTPLSPHLLNYLAELEAKRASK